MRIAILVAVALFVFVIAFAFVFSLRRDRVRPAVRAARAEDQKRKLVKKRRAALVRGGDGPRRERNLHASGFRIRRVFVARRRSTRVPRADAPQLFRDGNVRGRGHPGRPGGGPRGEAREKGGARGEKKRKRARERFCIARVFRIAIRRRVRAGVQGHDEKRARVRARRVTPLEETFSRCFLFVDRARVLTRGVRTIW